MSEGLVTFILSYHDLHELPRNRKVANETLNGAIGGSVANVFGQLLADPKPIRYGTNPGREFFYACTQSEKKFLVKSRIFLVNRRLYQLTCLMEESVFDQKLAEDFWGTFRLLESESDLPPRPKISR